MEELFGNCLVLLWGIGVRVSYRLYKFCVIESVLVGCLLCVCLFVVCFVIDN